MLKEVGDEDTVEVVSRKVSVQDVGNYYFNVGLTEFVVIDGVHRPPLRCRYRVDELAAARGRVEHLLRRAHAAVYIGGDLLPDRLAACLVDVPEAVLVQALVVDPHCHRHFPIADPEPAVRTDQELKGWLTTRASAGQPRCRFVRSDRQGSPAGIWESNPARPGDPCVSCLHIYPQPILQAGCRRAGRLRDWRPGRRPARAGTAAGQRATSRDAVVRGQRDVALAC